MIRQVSYEAFRLKKVEKKATVIKMEFECRYPPDEYQSEHVLTHVVSTNTASNAKVFDLLQDLQAFVSTEESNVEIVKLSVADLGYFDSYQLAYDVHFGGDDEKPTKVKEPKIELSSLGNALQLEEKLEQIKLCCYEYCILGTIFRPHVTKATIDEFGEITL
jgi:hypothetical protein